LQIDDRLLCLTLGVQRLRLLTGRVVTRLIDKQFAFQGIREQPITLQVLQETTGFSALLPS